MSEWLGATIAVGLGLAATAWTVWVWRWRADRGDHRLARWYHHHYRFQGWPFRSGAAASPVVAAWAFLFGIALVVGELAPEHAPALTGLGALVGLVLLIWTFWALLRPAAWMEPPWLVEARRREKAGLRSNVPVPPEGDRPVMGRRAFAVSIAAFGLLTAAWLYFELPIQHLLFGLAAGIPVLLATRIRK